MMKFKNGNALIVSFQRELRTSGGDEIVNIWGINYQPSFVYDIFWILKFSRKKIFLAVQDSSICDLVTHWLTDSLSESGFDFRLQEALHTMTTMTTMTT